MDKKVTMRLNRSFFKHWFMLRLNLISHDIRNCKETTTSVKECGKITEGEKK